MYSLKKGNRKKIVSRGTIIPICLEVFWQRYYDGQHVAEVNKTHWEVARKVGSSTHEGKPLTRTSSNSNREIISQMTRYLTSFRHFMKPLLFIDEILIILHPAIYDLLVSTGYLVIYVSLIYTLLPVSMYIIAVMNLYYEKVVYAHLYC